MIVEISISAKFASRSIVLFEESRSLIWSKPFWVRVDNFLCTSTGALSTIYVRSINNSIWKIDVQTKSLSNFPLFVCCCKIRQSPEHWRNLNFPSEFVMFSWIHRKNYLQGVIWVLLFTLRINRVKLLAINQRDSLLEVKFKVIAGDFIWIAIPGFDLKVALIGQPYPKHLWSQFPEVGRKLLKEYERICPCPQETLCFPDIYFHGIKYLSLRKVFIVDIEVRVAKFPWTDISEVTFEVLICVSLNLL